MRALIPIVVALLGAALPAQEPAAPAAARIGVERVDAALERGARWLRDQQQPDGGFAPGSVPSACRVALTAMATWGLNEPEPRCIPPERADAAARFLLANRRADGGIYDPARGLAVYTSGVAARALRTLGKRAEWPELAAAQSEAELFAYRFGAPESIVDATQPGTTPLANSAEAARELLGGTPSSDTARRKALEFLARSERSALRTPSRIRNAGPQHATGELGTFSYDDLLPFVYFDLAPEHQVALRAREALRTYYTPDRNPDLTKRYGEKGFGAGTQGLFYYYYVSAKSLSVFHIRSLVTADGVAHDWADELAQRIVRAQRPDGSWSNSDPQWWESEPVLVTSYALLTLKLCRAGLLDGAAR